MTIPLTIPAAFYLLFVLIYVVFTLINIHHILMSASLTAVSAIVSIGVIAAGIVTIYGTWFLLEGIDLNTTIELFNNNPLRPRGGTNFF